MISFLKKVIGYGLALLGLTGLVDNVVLWQGFFENVVTEYLTVRDFLFGWLPFELPNWTKDYVVLGAGMGASQTAMFRAYNPDFNAWRPTYLWLIVFVWPLFVWFYIKPFTCSNPSKSNLIFDAIYRVTAERFWKEVVIVIVIFIGALFLFSDILTKLNGG